MLINRVPGDHVSPNSPHGAPRFDISDASIDPHVVEPISIQSGVPQTQVMNLPGGSGPVKGISKSHPHIWPFRPDSGPADACRHFDRYRPDLGRCRPNPDRCMPNVGFVRSGRARPRARNYSCTGGVLARQVAYLCSRLMPSQSLQSTSPKLGGVRAKFGRSRDESG